MAAFYEVFATLSVKNWVDFEITESLTKAPLDFPINIKKNYIPPMV